VQKKTRPYFWFGGTQQWTTYTYDALSRVAIESLPDGHTIQHAFHGLVTSDTNQNGQTRTITKNSQGQVVSVTDAAGKTTAYYYDPFGNLVKIHDPLGNVVAPPTTCAGARSPATIRISALGPTATTPSGKWSARPMPRARPPR
jgi:YD repeat-containing protein